MPGLIVDEKISLAKAQRRQEFMLTQTPLSCLVAQFAVVSSLTPCLGDSVVKIDSDAEKFSTRKRWHWLSDRFRSRKFAQVFNGQNTFDIMTVTRGIVLTPHWAFPAARLFKRKAGKPVRKPKRCPQRGASSCCARIRCLLESFDGDHSI